MDFDTIVADGETALQDLVTASAQETVSLEFKSEAANGQGHPWVNSGKLTDSARKVLGKALSGLSNSAGGMLVLGVEARRGADGIDAAVELVPFPDLRLLFSLLNQAVGDLLQPKHEGIRLEAIPSSADPTKGYILVDVPRSERRPHRCEAKDFKQYFKRAGGSTFPMEHYDIEDAFRRVSSAELQLRYELAFGMSTRNGGVPDYQFKLILNLVNVGQTTARFPSVVLHDARKFHISPANFAKPMQNTWIEGTDIRVTGGADMVVHPEETRKFEVLQFNVSILNGTEMYRKVGEQLVPMTSDIVMPYRLYAENSRMREGNLTISRTHLVDFLASRG